MSVFGRRPVGDDLEEMDRRRQNVSGCTHDTEDNVRLSRLYVVGGTFANYISEHLTKSPASVDQPTRQSFHAK